MLTCVEVVWPLSVSNEISQWGHMQAQLSNICEACVQSIDTLEHWLPP